MPGARIPNGRMRSYSQAWLEFHADDHDWFDDEPELDPDDRFERRREEQAESNAYLRAQAADEAAFERRVAAFDELSKEAGRQMVADALDRLGEMDLRREAQV